MSYNLFEGKFETEANRQIRHEAFKSFYSVLEKYKNTTAMAYETEVQKQKSLATLRGFESVTDYLLFPQEISKKHYNRQLDIIMEKLAPHMRRYAMLLKRLHGLEKMTHMESHRCHGSRCGARASQALPGAQAPIPGPRQRDAPPTVHRP